MFCHPRFFLIRSLPACKVNMMKSLLLMGVNAAYGWGGRKGRGVGGREAGEKTSPQEKF